MKSRLVFGALTVNRLTVPSDGRRILEAIATIAPAASPEKFGHFEPIRTRFESFEQATAEWVTPFLWTHRTGGRAEGALWFNNPGAHSAAFVTFSGKALPTAQVSELLPRLDGYVPCDFGYVHLVTEAERCDKSIPYDEWYPVDVGITTHDLRKGVPSVCWGMLFGPPYVELIGEDRLRSAPWASSQRLASGAVFAQATSSRDLADFDFSIVKSRHATIRMALKEYFRQDGHAAERVPIFDL